MSGEKKQNIDKQGKDGTSSEESDPQSEPERNIDSTDEASTEALQTKPEKEPTADVIDTLAKTSQWCFQWYKVYIRFAH